MKVQAPWLPLVVLASLGCLPGCCFGAPPPPVAPTPAASTIDPSHPTPLLPPPPSYEPPPVYVPPPRDAQSDPFTLDPSVALQIPDVRARYDQARPIEGALAGSVLVCRVRLHGGGWDDSFFAGGADVALAARIGDGAVQSTPESSQRVYSFAAPSLAAGDAVWIRVIDRDVFFDDTIGEGTATYEHAPFSLTMGSADVECRALAPALVQREADAARADLASRIARLEPVTPDLARDDLAFPSSRASAVVQASRRVAAWTGASDPDLTTALEPAHAWVRTWNQDVRDAIEHARATLPRPDAPVVEGGRALSITRVACGHDGEALRAEIGRPEIPGARYCIAILHVTGGALALRDDQALAATWALDDDGGRVPVTAAAVRSGDTWRPVTERIEGERDVALVLGTDDPPALLRAGAPFASGILLRLR